MKILVSTKRVIDYNVRIRFKQKQIETDVKMSMNPFDEIAVEEAVRLKEKGVANEIVVVSIGTLECQEVLRSALAMGADRAILVKTDRNDLSPLVIAKVLRHLVQIETPNLVLMGKQAIDDDCNQTGQMLAALLNWPQATFASKLVIQNDLALVTREIDGGLETLQLQLPAVVTTDLRLNEPRYISLPNIMKAKQKSLNVLSLDELGIDTQNQLIVQAVEPPSVRKAGVKVASVQELMDKLKEANIL